MSEHSTIYPDIAMVLLGAFIYGLLSWRLREPLLLGYVFAGLILSALTPVLTCKALAFFETMAEIVVILLLFSVGTNSRYQNSLKVKRVALLGARTR